MNRNKLRHVLLPALSLSLLLSACNLSSGADSESSSEEVEVIRQGVNLPDPENDVIKQELDDVLGFPVNLSVNPNDYENKLNVRLSAGDYPDLFQVSRAALVDYANKGLLLDLDPYMDDLQEVQDFIGEENVEKAKVNEKVYAVTVPASIPFYTYWVREDWLEALNMDMPKTVDDLYEVAKAFREDDPDGNGQKDTYGLTGSGVSAFQPILGAYGVGMPKSFYKEDGELVNSFHDPDMKEALTAVTKFVENDVTDPEIFSNTGNEPQQKAFQGKFGILFDGWANLTSDAYIEQYKAVDPNAEWVQLTAIEGPAGKSAGTWDIGQANGFYAIPKALEDQPEKLEKIFELLNYVASDEGSKLVQYGIEGEHYNKEDGKIVPTDKLAEEGGYFWLYQFAGRPEMEYLSTKFSKQTEYIEASADAPRIESLNGYIDYPEGYNSADADRFSEEEMIKFISGQRNLSEYDEFLNKLDTTFNYQMMLDKAEEDINKLDQ